MVRVALFLKGRFRLSKKIHSAQVFSENIAAFRCPHCKGAMKVVDLTSLKCENNHTFDFAKQGYVNLLTHAVNSHYNKELFEARQKVIVESSLYTKLHESIARVIQDFQVDHKQPAMVADLGCGEGSHLQRILDKCENSTLTGVGLDISKEGIMLAAKKYENPIWIVGDLADSPLMDQSYSIILNILSPSNYKEFKRILVKDGLVLKVVPRSNYLKELREAFYDKDEKKVYKNDEIVSLFEKHFHLLDTQILNYTISLNKEEWIRLVHMTPLTWSVEKERIDQFINQGSAKITVDLAILVGQNK